MNGIDGNTVGCTNGIFVRKLLSAPWQDGSRGAGKLFPPWARIAESYGNESIRIVADGAEGYCFNNRVSRHPTITHQRNASRKNGPDDEEGKGYENQDYT